MILLFSVANDYTTYEVIQWLHHLGEHHVIRINYDDAHGNRDLLLHVKESDFTVHLNDKEIRLPDIKAVWYRKGRDWLCDQFYPITLENHSRLSQYLTLKARREQYKLSEYIHLLLEQSVPVLGSAFKSDLNKLVTLQAAKAVGLNIPPFHVVNFKSAVKELCQTEQGFITKSMSDGIYFFEKKEAQTGYFTYTEQLSEEELAALPERISPSFLQCNIQKQLEIRVFFLEDRCYAMAIFSQSDTKTKVDYRKYNHQKPNRCVPYQLPSELASKLIKLFKAIGLNTGSVDLILDSHGEFYFLEINPVGQFGMVSKPCNYQLEKKVALKLQQDARRTTITTPNQT